MGKEKGFTITELVVVLSLVSVLASVAMFKYPGRASMDLSASTEQLKRDIRLTQSLAMHMNGAYSIQINANNYQILKPDGSNYTHPARNTNPVTLPTGLSLSPVQRIRFVAGGQAAANAQIRISNSSGNKYISIQSPTGYVQSSDKEASDDGSCDHDN